MTHVPSRRREPWDQGAPWPQSAVRPSIPGQMPLFADVDHPETDATSPFWGYWKCWLFGPGAFWGASVGDFDRYPRNDAEWKTLALQVAASCLLLRPADCRQQIRSARVCAGAVNCDGSPLVADLGYSLMEERRQLRLSGAEVLAVAKRLEGPKFRPRD